MPHPVFPTLARSHIAPSKCQSRNLRVRNFYPRRTIFRQQAHEAVGKPASATTIENVPFNLRAVFPRDRDIATIIERLLERLAEVFLIGQRRHRPLKLFVKRSRNQFERVRVRSSGRPVPSFPPAQTRVSSPAGALICTRGLTACAG